HGMLTRRDPIRLEADLVLGKGCSNAEQPHRSSNLKTRHAYLQVSCSRLEYAMQKSRLQLGARCGQFPANIGPTSVHIARLLRQLPTLCAPCGNKGRSAAAIDTCQARRCRCEPEASARSRPQEPQSSLSALNCAT